MADSYTIYTANGSQDTFNITFGYLDPAHVFVTVDNIAATFTFPTGSQVQLSSTPANGAKVRVYRVTPRDVRQIVWQNAANLTANDLNTADLQLLYIVQEAFDNSEDAMNLDNSGNFDAEGKRITNVGTPTQSTDAATKAYVDASTIDIVGDAEDARDDAQQAATDAQAALAKCQTIYDNFDDRYLGQKSSAPTVDNDGSPLLDGALYYNTVDNKMYVYDFGTTSWLAIETNIPDGSITTVKLGALAVTAAKVADGAISTAAKVVDGILTYAKLASSAIATTAEILAGTVNKIVTANQLQPLLIFTKQYASPAQTWSAGGTVTLAHGMATVPKAMHMYIKCTSAEQGYSVGDELVVPAFDDSGGLSNGVAVVQDATNIFLRYGQSMWVVPRKDTGVRAGADSTKWQFYVRAYA